MLLGYRIGHVCFVFSLASHSRGATRRLHESIVSHSISPNDPTISHYAFILWFEPISSPSPHSKLRTVWKMRVGNQQATAIVHITDIKFACELSPVLGDSFWDGTKNQDFSDSSSFNTFETFYVNCFGGHLDYEFFA